MSLAAPKAKSLLAPAHRGNLLDLSVVAANLGPVEWLGAHVGHLTRTADQDRTAALVLGLLCLGMLVLPAAGAVLKRWHSHQRWALELRRHEQAGMAAQWSAPRPGCLFSPLFYFALSFTVATAVVTLFGGSLFGPDFHQQNGARFLALMLLALVASVAQTALVYRYFAPPKRAPRSAFLRSPDSDRLGDACLYLNMLLFQVLWAVLSQTPFGPVTDLEDFAGRLFFFGFTSLLLYFPPRMLYLVEDLRRPFSWLTLLLANGSTLARVLFGFR